MEPSQPSDPLDTLNSHSKKHLQELLSCFICYERARGASMCPFCSKIYCQSCLKRSLSHKQECPNCRKSLKASSMTYCSRFINELALLLEDLIDLRALDEKCLEHNVEQNYYCRSCGLPICCECEMFGEHRGHHIDHLCRIYELKCQPVREGLLALKKELKAKEAHIKAVKDRNGDLAKEKERRRAEAEENNQVYKIKIFTEVEEEENALQEESHLLKQNLKALEEIENTVLRVASNNTMMTEIDRPQYEEIQKIVLERSGRDAIQDKLDLIIRELVPPYEQVVYTLENFSRRRKEKSIVYSPVVDFEGTQWRLKIHPNGSEAAEGTHFSIFLQLVSSIRKDNLFQYKIEIWNPSSPSLHFFREYGSNFEESGSCWGYIKYIKIEDLLHEGYLLNDCLSIRYNLRHPSYYHLSLFQEEYCTHLDKEIEAQEDTLAKLEEDLQFL